MKRIAVVFGTRPEAIKLAPVIKELESREGFEPWVIVTGQHRDMLDQCLDTFKLVPDADLDLMTDNQTLFELTSRAIPALGASLAAAKPDMVLVQGDTTTTFAASLAAYYLQIPVAHVEAGLRSFDKRQPFPEEVNRRMTSVLADVHFAPTAAARANLLAEGIEAESIHVTGNTVIDSLFWVLENAKASGVFIERTRPRRMLVTAHRRENWGSGIENICRAVMNIADDHDDLEVVFSCHLNPNVRGKVEELLVGHPQVNLIAPQDYVTFVHLMNSSDLILTDSGGIQEEAPSLGKPVLVARNVTERPEGVAAGTVRLVGTSAEMIASHASHLLNDELEYGLMAQAANPYGAGNAAKMIVDALHEAGEAEQTGEIARRSGLVGPGAESGKTRSARDRR